MFQFLKRRLRGSGSPSQRKTDADFIRRLNESYTYLRLHRYRVLSTELPDDLLKRWLMPNPDNPGTSEYMRNFIRQNDTLSETYLPAFVFDHVLKHRFGRDIAAFGKSDMEDAAYDLRTYILLLNYIFGMREAGRTPIEFDIFDIGNYDTIIRRVENGEPEKDANAPDGKRELSDSEIIAVRNAIFGDLMDGYIDDVIRVLKEYMSIDFMRHEDILLRVIFRDMAHFDMNPELSMRENSRDMFVNKIDYIDDDSFELHLTEANVHLDDLMAKLFRWRKIRRTTIVHHIVIRRGESQNAPYIAPATFYPLKMAVIRYDAYERGLRHKAGLRNSREMKQEAKDFAQDLKRVADKHGIDLIRLLNKIG